MSDSIPIEDYTQPEQRTNQCPHCPYNSNRYDNFTRHRKSQHTIDYSTITSIPELEELLPFASDEALFAARMYELITVETQLLKRTIKVLEKYDNPKLALVTMIPLPTHTCTKCDETFQLLRDLYRHRREQHPEGDSKIAFVLKRSALKDCIREYRGRGEINPLYPNVQPDITHFLQYVFKMFDGMKFQISYYVRMSKLTHSDDFPFNSDYEHVTNHDSVATGVVNALTKIFNSIETFETQGSGWAIEDFLTLELTVVSCNPLQRSSTPAAKKRKAATYLVH